MFGARLLIGFGAGSSSVCMAYVSGATTIEVNGLDSVTCLVCNLKFQERSKAMAFLAAVTGLGFIFGNAFVSIQDFAHLISVFLCRTSVCISHSMILLFKRTQLILDSESRLLK